MILYLGQPWHNSWFVTRRETKKDWFCCSLIYSGLKLKYHNGGSDVNNVKILVKIHYCSGQHNGTHTK